MLISTQYWPTSCVLNMTFDTDDEEAGVVEDPPTGLGGFLALLNRFEESWKALPNLVIEPRAVVANFSYSMMPLVADLGQNGELFAASDIVAAIAGDREAREALASRICDPKPNQPDIDPPLERISRTRRRLQPARGDQSSAWRRVARNPRSARHW